MEAKEALNMLAQVVEQYFRGLPPEQRTVAQALQVLVKAVTPEEKKDEPIEGS